MKDTRSILLILLSLGLIGTWVYHLNEKTHYYYPAEQPPLPAADTSGLVNRIRDSILRLYTDSLKKRESNDILNTSGKAAFDQKFEQINELKKQIRQILRTKNVKDSDLKQARILVMNLKNQINELQLMNGILERERNRLIADTDSLNREINRLQLYVQQLNKDNSDLTRVVNDASTFLASGIVMKALNLHTGKRENETRFARKTDKLVITCTVQNMIKSYSQAELFIIITDPRGTTMTGSKGENGLFGTRNEGTKIFTQKITFEYEKGNSRKLLISLSRNQFEPGLYRAILYHNGYRIGEATLVLS